MMNKDLMIGLLIGIIAPIIAFIVYVVFYRGDTLEYFMSNLITDRNLPAIISLSLLTNLAIFFLNIQIRRDNWARGILFATMLYGFAIVILKFI